MPQEAPAFGSSGAWAVPVPRCRCRGASELSAAGAPARDATRCCSPAPRGAARLPAGVRQVAAALRLFSRLWRCSGGLGGSDRFLLLQEMFTFTA